LTFRNASSQRLLSRWLWCTLAVFLAGCASSAKLPLTAVSGSTPSLPEPSRSRIATVNVAKVVGWSGSDHPIAFPGTSVSAFARNLDHPRWLYVLPNGDVLVAESNAPDRPEMRTGVRSWFLRMFMHEGGAGDPSANRITLLRDADGDGVAEMRSVFARNLNSPFGMALIGNSLYVANTDAVVSFPYTTGQIEITSSPTKVVDLPAGRINHHWTRGLVASTDGSKLYVSVGSNSDHAERGLDKETERAAILEIDPRAHTKRIYASGMRNPIGMEWVPGTDALWAAVNEREELGGDLPPDYMTAVRPGGFYGWPFSYHGTNVDPRVEPQNRNLVASAITPDYALGPHTASMGIAWAGSKTLLPPRFQNGMIVTQHGSWNRIPLDGYRVVFVPFTNGKPAGQPQVLLTGFLDRDDHAQGRPAGVAIDARGGVLVADDAGNVIWRVTTKVASPQDGERP
jgi:glucose/arabinose dehydrogenase